MNNFVSTQISIFFLFLFSTFQPALANKRCELALGDSSATNASPSIVKAGALPLPSMLNSRSNQAQILEYYIRRATSYVSPGTSITTKLPALGETTLKEISAHVLDALTPQNRLRFSFAISTMLRQRMLFWTREGFPKDLGDEITLALLRAIEDPRMKSLLVDHLRSNNEDVTHFTYFEMIARYSKPLEVNHQLIIGLLTAPITDSAASIERLNEISESLRDYASSYDNPNYDARHLKLAKLYSSLPEYVRFKLMKENLRRWNGRPSEILNDIVIQTTPRGSKAFVYSNVKFENSESFLGGLLYFRELGSVELSTRGQKLSWDFLGEVREAIVKKAGTTGVVRSPVESGAQLKHQELRKDGKLSGAIVVTNNMADFSKTLLGYYREYFTDQGYRFGRVKTMNGEQAIEFLVQQVSKGQLDYLIREGHSEASNDVLISLPSGQIGILEGKKSNPETGDESILLIGRMQSGSPQGISGQLPTGILGEALSSRSTGTQFIYADTSCYNGSCILETWKGVANSSFVPLASNESMETFEEVAGHGVFELIEGLRLQRSWSEIWERTTESPLLNPKSGGYPSSTAFNRERPTRVLIDRSFEVTQEHSGE